MVLFLILLVLLLVLDVLARCWTIFL